MRLTQIYHDDLLEGCFRAQPEAALEALCGGDASELEKGIRTLEDFQSHKHPLVAVPDETLLYWCDQGPATRYPAIARIVPISHNAKGSKEAQWTPIALRFLERAPDPAGILRQFVSQFSPTEGWRGTLSATLESNAVLLDQLESYPNLKKPVEYEKMRLRQLIEDQKSEEAADARERDERFE